MEPISLPGIITALFISAMFIACSPSKRKEEGTVQFLKGQTDPILGSWGDERDAAFIAETVSGNYAEIKLAQLALNKSTNSHIREMAREFVRDHSKVLNDFSRFASSRGIRVPREENPHAKEQFQDLARKDPKEFNQSWCVELEGKHELSIRKFEGIWDKTNDKELKALIVQTLPELKNHLEKLVEYHEKNAG